MNGVLIFVCGLGYGLGAATFVTRWLDHKLEKTRAESLGLSLQNIGKELVFSRNIAGDGFECFSEGSFTLDSGDKIILKLSLAPPATIGAAA